MGVRGLALQVVKQGQVEIGCALFTPQPRSRGEGSQRRTGGHRETNYPLRCSKTSGHFDRPTLHPFFLTPHPSPLAPSSYSSHPCRYSLWMKSWAAGELVTLRRLASHSMGEWLRYEATPRSTASVSAP